MAIVSKRWWQAGYAEEAIRQVEPLATDAERLAAGWLDPERAQALLDAARAWRASRSLVEEYNMDDDEIRLEAVVNALDAPDTEAEHLAGTDRLRRERDEARARLNEVSNDRLAQLRRFAAQQPVIDAAREWSKVMRLAEEVYGPAILRFQHSRALADAVAALDAAEAAPC